MKTLLTILLIGYSTFSFSQSDFFKDRNPDLEIGINTDFKLNTLELGVNLYKVFGGSCHGPLVSNSLIFGAEFGMKNNDILYAPKITFSENLLFLDASISAINYNYLNSHNLYIRPQLGATYFGYIDLVYGYNIPIIDRNREFQGSMLTLRCKLDFFKEILNN